MKTALNYDLLWPVTGPPRLLTVRVARRQAFDHFWW